MSSAVGALLIFAALSLLPALVVYRSRRQVVDPRVIFPTLYFLLTAGPVLWHLTGGQYYFGMEVEKVPDVLLACSSAIFAFVIGSSVAIVSARKATKRARALDPSVLLIARLVLLVATTVLLLAYGYVSFRLKQSSAGLLKASAIVSAGPEMQRWYYFLGAGLFVSTTALIALDSYVAVGRRTFTILGILGLYLALQTWNNEREVALVLGAWILLNARFWTRRFIIALVTGVVAFVAIIAVVRGGRAANRGDDTDDQQVSDLAESLLTKSSSNLFIFSKVMVWVPDDEPYRWGSSYGDAVIGFFPGAPKESQQALSDWFRNRYAPGNSSGYGFAMDAEAYLNFGWAGPPLVFFLWGVLLGGLFARARRPGAGWFESYLWVLITSYSIFAVRGESRELFKILAYGGIGGGLVLSISTLLAGVARRRLPRDARQGSSSPEAGRS